MLQQLTVIMTVAACGLALATLPAAALPADALSALDGLKAQYLPAEYQNLNFTLDDLKNVINAKCRKASLKSAVAAVAANNGTLPNNTQYEEIEAAAAKMFNCISQLVNVTAITEEIEEARPLGELDSVFHKYCGQVPIAEQCVNEFSSKLQPCLSVAERLQAVALLQITHNLMGYLCAKGGDQIALFVAEQGPECLEANREPIGHCVNATFGEFMPALTAKLNATQVNLYDLPELVLTSKHCIDLERLEACTLRHLQQCEEITPANVAESVFRFIKTETNCTHIKATADTTEKAVLRASPRSAAGHIGAGWSVAAATVLTLFALSRQ